MKFPVFTMCYFEVICAHGMLKMRILEMQHIGFSFVRGF